MDYSIDGSIAQHARLEFAQGDEVWLSNGSLMSYSADVSWNLKVPGGVSGALKRGLSGEGLALTRARAASPNQFALIAANSPGHIRVWDLENSAVITTRGSFLAAWGNVDINVTVARRAGAAFFGGAGLFLQEISGTGTVLIHGSGDMLEQNLSDNQSMIVSTGNLAAFSPEVDYNIEAVGSVRKFLFSGEGLFMTRVTGPGRVLLQTLKQGVKVSAKQ